MQVVLITGATSGIGKLAANKFYSKGGYHLILGCRNKSKTTQVIDWIKNSNPSSNSKIEFLELDLNSFKSIKKFSQEFLEKKLPLHILVLNAGIAPRAFQLTEDGFESTFGTNHLGHFLLTNLLLDTIKKSAPARVVVVSSKLHMPGVGSGKGPALELDSSKINDPSIMEIAYRNSKLANMWFTYELARRLEGTGITVNAISPGFIPTTGLFQHAAFVVRIFLSWILYYFPFARSEDFGAECIIDAAMNERYGKETAKFISEKKEIPSSDESYNQEKQRKLWELSEKWTGLK